MGSARVTGFQQARQLVERTSNIKTQQTTGLVDMTTEVFNASLFQDIAGTAEKIGDYKINGNKGMVGDTFVRNVFSIKTPNESILAFKNLVSFIEQEAIVAGATKIQIGGYAIFNSGFLNPRVAARFGYVLKIIDKSTVILEKGF